MLGYQKQHIRETLPHSKLSISFETFCEQVKKSAVGNILLCNKGFVENGFALRSESYTYYGVVENGLIKTLCVAQLDYVDDEFLQIVNSYGLLMVDWCNANVLGVVEGEGVPENLLQSGL